MKTSKKKYPPGHIRQVLAVVLHGEGPAHAMCGYDRDDTDRELENMRKALAFVLMHGVTVHVGPEDHKYYSMCSDEEIIPPAELLYILDEVRERLKEK